MLHNIALLTIAFAAKQTLAQFDNSSNPYDAEWRTYFASHPHEFAEYERGFQGYFHEHPTEYQHYIHPEQQTVVLEQQHQEPAHWTQAQIDLYYQQHPAELAQARQKQQEELAQKAHEKAVEDYNKAYADYVHAQELQTQEYYKQVEAYNAYYATHPSSPPQAADPVQHYQYMGHQTQLQNGEEEKPNKLPLCATDYQCGAHCECPWDEVCENSICRMKHDNLCRGFDCSSGCQCSTGFDCYKGTCHSPILKSLYQRELPSDYLQ